MRVDQFNFKEVTQRNQIMTGVPVIAEQKSADKIADSLGLAVQVKEGTYQKPVGGVLEEIQDAAAQEMDQASLRHQEMAVLSGSMSPEDLKEFEEQGYDLKDSDVETVVTVVDKIKIALAKGGKDVSVMGGLDQAVVEQALGNGALARSIEQLLEQADLPQTNENISDLKKTMDLGEVLSPLSNGALKYMVENQLPASIENLYLAENSVGPNFGNEMLSEEDAVDLQKQMTEIIGQTPFSKEEALEKSGWMVANEIPLTPENLTRVMELSELSLPVSKAQVLNAGLEALQEGKRPQEGVLLEQDRLVFAAEECMEVVENATEEDLAYLIAEGKEINIRNLQEASWSREEAGVVYVLTDEQKGQLVTAQRKLEETRLMMTVEANYRLLKQGVSIDTKPLEEVVEQLKAKEQEVAKAMLTSVGLEGTQEQIATYEMTFRALYELERSPAYALATADTETTTLGALHDSAVALQLRMEQAGEAYETMGTEVRKDLGDSIQKAFRNVDVILEDLGLEKTAENQRAVRILGYNNLNITEENIAQMKAVDEEVQHTFRSLTPNTVLEMIRRNENPLDATFAKINEVTESIQQEQGATEEKYSEFLYKLDQNKGISPEERESYIGIYRLMNLVEQSDGAAIGALVHQGAEITMRNLLTAVRSAKREDMEYTIDDSFGGASSTLTNSVIDQVLTAFSTNLVKDTMAVMTPENLKLAMSEENWQEQSLEQFHQTLLNQDVEDESRQAAIAKLQELADAKDADVEVYRYLESFELPTTVNNVLAMQQMMQQPGAALRKLFGMENAKYHTENGDVDFDAIKEDLLRQFGEAMETPEEMAEAEHTLEEVATNVMKTMIADTEVTDALDLKELQMMTRQLSIAGAMAKKGNYNVPILVQGESGEMTLKIVHGEGKGLVDINFTLSALGSVMAHFKVQQNQLSGYVVAENQETADLFSHHAEELTTAMEEEGLEQVHIDVLKEQVPTNPMEYSTEDLEGADTKVLYHVAKRFWQLLQSF